MRTDQEIWEAVQSRFDVGGGYYNPVNECLTVGRPLCDAAVEQLTSSVHGLNVTTGEAAPTHYASSMFARLTSLLTPNELLFGVYARPDFSFAVYLFDEERLLQFEVQVADWKLERRSFLALNRDTATEGLEREFEAP